MDQEREPPRRPTPQTGPGGGAAYDRGYGAGGLGSGADRARGEEAPENVGTWDAPGVTPDGRRTGSSREGPQMSHQDEAPPGAGNVAPEPRREE